MYRVQNLLFLLIFLEGRKSYKFLYSVFIAPAKQKLGKVNFVEMGRECEDKEREGH